MLKVFRLLAAAVAALALFSPGARAGDKGASLRFLGEGEAHYRRGAFKDAMRSVNTALETDSRNGQAYVGSAMGRELVYERSREQVQADIDRLNPHLRNSRGR